MEDKIIKQAKVKKTLGTVIKVFMYLVLAVLIAGAVLLICAEAGVPAAVKATEWIQAKWGVVLGISALSAMVLLLKALSTIYNTTNSNESKNDELIAEILRLTGEVANAKEEALKAAESVTSSAGTIDSRNGAIDSLQGAVDLLGEQQGVLFETMKLFVTANTNNPTIKSIFQKFEETQLFAKAKQYGEQAIYAETIEAKESVKDIIESGKGLASAAKTILPTVKDTVRTIIKK